MKNSVRIPVSMFALLALGCQFGWGDPCAAPDPLPPGFAEEIILSFADTPINVATPLPDGRMIIGTGDGRAYVMLGDDTLAEEPFVDYDTVPWTVGETTIEVEAEGGVIGCVPSPTFSTDHYIYLSHTTNRVTYPNGRHLVITRFELEPSGTGVVENSATEIFSVRDAIQGTDFHSGGGLSFDSGGMLYFGLGDDGNVNAPQNLNSERGKVLRMNPDGSAPSDNPFYQQGGSGIRQYIYALGLRNPYRNLYDPVRDRMLTTDTGQARWEELNVLEAGGNYGWTLIEGPVSDSPNAELPDDYVDPLFAYPHNLNDIGGIAIVGAAVYTGSQFPAEYNGDYFVTEWGSFSGPAKIFRLQFDQAGDLADASIFHAERILGFSDINVAADGSLVFTLANIVGGASIRGQVRRITYTEPDDPPVVTADANVLTGPAPLIVLFDGSVTDDSPSPADFCWRFGDGNTNSSSIDPQKTYGVPGIYTATLTAEDEFRSRSSESVTISVYGTYDISGSGTLYAADTETPAPLEGTVTLLQPFTRDPIPVTRQGITTNPDGTFSFSLPDAQVFGTYVIARFEAPGYVAREYTVAASGGNVNVSGDFYLSSSAFVGTVAKADASPVPSNDVFLQILDNGQPIPYAVPDGIDNPQFPTGVDHGTRTNAVGDYYLPVRTDDVGEEFQLSANTIPSLTGYFPAVENATAAAGALTTDFTLNQISGTSDCTDVFPPSPLNPPFAAIQDIFNSHCIGCHAGFSPNADLTLDEGFAYSSIVEIASNEHPNRRLIDTTSAGDAVVNSWLVEKVRCSRPSYGSIMPPTGKITGEDITLIGEWARRGAPHDIVEAAVEASRDMAESGTQIRFRAGVQGPGAPFSFTWDFGDGSSAEGSRVAKTYIVPDGFEVYTVTVSAWDKDENLLDTASVNVTITESGFQVGSDNWLLY